MAPQEMPTEADLKNVLRILEVTFKQGDDLGALCIAVYKALASPCCMTVKTGEAGKITIDNKSSRDLKAVVIPVPTRQQLKEAAAYEAAGLSAGKASDQCKVVEGGERDSTPVKDNKALVTLSYDVQWQNTPDIQLANEISMQLRTQHRILAVAAEWISPIKSWTGEFELRNPVGRFMPT
eukprot:gene14450-20462_t